jgi:type IV pilus assembly protein PilO
MSPMQTIQRTIAPMRRLFFGIQKHHAQHPSQWPRTPYVMLFVGIGIMLLLGAWQLLWRDTWEALQQAQSETQTLKSTYAHKVTLSQQLVALKAQEQQLQQSVIDIQPLRTNTADMDTLLSAITQAGIATGIRWTLFKPSAATQGTHYVEIPITVRVQGKYQAIDQFIQALATLPQIISLHNLQLHALPQKEHMPTTLSMDAVIKVYRFATNVRPYE